MFNLLRVNLISENGNKNSPSAGGQAVSKEDYEEYKKSEKTAYQKSMGV